MLYLDMDTIGRRGSGHGLRLRSCLTCLLFCFTCFDLPFIYVSIERAHTSFVAELWMDSFSFAGPVSDIDAATSSYLHPQGSTYPPGYTTIEHELLNSC